MPAHKPRGFALLPKDKLLRVAASGGKVALVISDSRTGLLAPIVPSAELYDRQRTPSPGLMAARLREDRKPRKHQADAAKANPAKGPGAYKQHHEPCPEVLLHAVSPGLVDDLHPET